MRRRAVLLGLGAAALSALAACRARRRPETEGEGADPGDSGAPPSGPREDEAPRACPGADPIGPEAPPPPGWVAVPLDAHPALQQVGGSVLISEPSALLEVILAQPHAGCFVAVWRVCTHGACELTWSAERGGALCPCHGSLFGPDGAVQVGPATRPIRAFPVARQGSTLWIDARRG